MRIVHDYGLVRVVSLGDPFSKTHDIVVEFRHSEDQDWQFYTGYNSLSNDYAYTSARESAGQCIAGLARLKAAELPNVA